MDLSNNVANMEQWRNNMEQWRNNMTQWRNMAQWRSATNVLPPPNNIADLSNNMAQWRNTAPNNIADLSNNMAQWRNNIADLSNNFFRNINENLFLSPIMSTMSRLFPPSFPTTDASSNPTDVSSNRPTFLDTFSQILNGSNSLINQSLNDESKYKKVLDEKGLDQIESVIYNSDEFPDNKQCPISFLDFKQGEEISKLPCGHIFHEESILKWLENEQANCPVCRYELSSKEVKNTDISENIIPRQTFTELFRNMIIEREEQRDEEVLQRAILESLNIN